MDIGSSRHRAANHNMLSLAPPRAVFIYIYLLGYSLCCAVQNTKAGTTPTPEAFIQVRVQLEQIAGNIIEL